MVKVAHLQMLKKINLCSVEKSIITDPLIQLTKSLVKHGMYSRNIPMAEKRIFCFQRKKVEICRFLFISNNNYIYLKRYFEIFVTYDVIVYSGGQSSALNSKMIKQFWSKDTQKSILYQLLEITTGLPLI